MWFLNFLPFFNFSLLSSCSTYFVHDPKFYLILYHLSQCLKCPKGGIMAPVENLWSKKFTLPKFEQLLDISNLFDY